METGKSWRKLRLCSGRLERLVAGAVLTSVLALSAGCTDIKGYVIGEEHVRFERQQTTNTLTATKFRSFRPYWFTAEYEKVYIDFGNNSTVDVYSVTDGVGKTTYYASSPNPIDKKVVAIAQRQFDAYLSKIAEIQTAK